MAKRLLPICSGDVFMPFNERARDSHRRVLAIMKISTRARTLFARPIEQIVYSTGGHHTYTCSTRTMHRWGLRIEIPAGGD